MFTLWLESVLVVSGVAQRNDLPIGSRVGDRTLRYDDIARVGAAGTLESSLFLTANSVGRLVAETKFDFAIIHTSGHMGTIDTRARAWVSS